MKLTPEQQYILFSLGSCLDEIHKKFEGKPIAVTIPKTAFIEIMMKAGMVQKQTRALYKNLETLEMQRLLSYDNKMLSLTSKGQKQYEHVKKEMAPFVKIISLLEKTNILEYTKKARTILTSF